MAGSSREDQMTIRPLTAFAGGATVLVVEVGDCTTRSRLAHRGILPGALLSIIRVGDPMIVGIDESRFAISGHDAACILTTLLADAATPSAPSTPSAPPAPAAPSAPAAPFQPAAAV